MTTCGYFGGLRRCGFGRRGGGGLLGLGWWLGGRSCASRGKSLTPPDRVGMNSGVSYRGGLGLEWFGLFGFGGGREEVVVVVVDGVADGLTPGIGAKGVDVFVLGDVDGLHESLDQVGDGVGGLGFYIAADNGGDEACQGGAEIAGGEVVAGEEVGQVFAEFLCGAGAGLFLGVVGAEAGIVADARSAATAAIGERKRTQGHAVLCTERGHKSLLRVEFWDCLLRRAQAEACPACSRQAAAGRYVPPTRKNAGKMPAVQKRNAPTGSGRSDQQKYCTTTVMRVKLKIRGKIWRVPRRLGPDYVVAL